MQWENNVSNSDAEYVITLIVMSCLVVQEKASDSQRWTHISRILSPLSNQHNYFPVSLFIYIKS